MLFVVRFFTLVVLNGTSINQQTFKFDLGDGLLTAAIITLKVGAVAVAFYLAVALASLIGGPVLRLMAFFMRHAGELLSGLGHLMLLNKLKPRNAQRPADDNEAPQQRRIRFQMPSLPLGRWGNRFQADHQND